jgi:hypothetical protein
VVFTAAPGPDEGPDGRPDGLAFVVALGEDDFGFGLLHDWKASASLIAMVLPPGSKLIRLRSVDSLQHLSLRRVEDS